MNHDDESRDRNERAKVIALLLSLALLTIAVFVWVCVRVWGIEATVLVFGLLLVITIMEGIAVGLPEGLLSAVARFAKWLFRRNS